ncbi:MAG: LacI family DNA-binding transcriptional regulator [Erysipelotrichaceae bacterium]|nr:LacI family DNA-binding transcriptional regulator [Erysipelotrichaceae bacterium]
MTIKDVAQAAGVSPGTVSKVLKNYPGISEATAGKVRQAVRDLGYIPNSMASALSSKEARGIGLYICINDRTQQIDEIDMNYLLGAFAKTEELGLNPVTIFDQTLMAFTAEELPAVFRSRGLSTIVIFGLNKNDEKMISFLQDERFRFVIVDAPYQDEHRSSVSIDHEQGQYEVAKEVLQQGQKVLYLAGKKDGYVTDERLRGIRKAAGEADAQLEVVYAEFSEQKAYEIVREKTGFDVYVCASDLMALGARRALWEKGLKRTVTGFDGIRLLAYAAPDVLTCKQDFQEIGKAAVSEAARLLKGEEGRKVILPHEITTVTMK